MTKMYYITMGCQVHTFTDHSNLLTMYDPFSHSDTLPMYAINKLMRWALLLSAFNYFVEHRDGNKRMS